MLKGRYSAIVFSILLHAAIILLVAKTIVVPPLPEQKPIPLQSYIYTPPAVEEIPEVPEIPQETTELQEEPTEPEPELEPEPVEQYPEASEPAETPVPEPEQAMVNDSQTIDSSDAETSEQPSASFSPLNQLHQLKNQIDAQLMQKESYQFGRRKSASVLDGEPIPVPHSNKQYSEEEKREQASYQLDTGMKTVKGDNGTCVIERDLSAVGIEGVTSSEAFACGQSKFDKSFKDHMKKVLKKLGK